MTQPGVNIERRNLEHMCKFNHASSLISFFGCFNDTQYTFFVFEKGDVSLEKFLDDHYLNLSIAQYNEILSQIYSMLSYLDTIQLYHNDFHSRNMVIILGDGLIKLIDFGKSCLPEDKDFKPPLSELKQAGMLLVQLQLMMRYKSDSESYFSAFVRFLESVSREPLILSGSTVTDASDTLLSDLNIWLPELPSETRELVIKAFSPDINEQKMALIASQNVIPREVLKA